MRAIPEPILAALEPDARLAPASLTKLLTGYVTFQGAGEEQIRSRRRGYGQRKRMAYSAARECSSRWEPRAGRDLMMGMIVQSGNDASVALAEHVAGTESVFAEMMNQLRRGTRHEREPLHEFHRPAGRRTLLDRARPGHTGPRHDQRISRLLRLVLGQGIQMQRHHAEKPQQAAVAAIRASTA